MIILINNLMLLLPAPLAIRLESLGYRVALLVLSSCLFLVSSLLFFCLVPCGRLSWLLVSIWAHVNIVHLVVSYRM